MNVPGKEEPVSEEEKDMVCVTEKLLVGHSNGIEWAAAGRSQEGTKLRHWHRKNEDGRKGAVLN